MPGQGNEVALACESDGRRISKMEELSRKDQPLKKWRQSVVDALKNNKTASMQHAGDYLEKSGWVNEDPSKADSGALKTLLDHEAYSSDKGPAIKGGLGVGELPTQMGMWSAVYARGKGVNVDDTCWDYRLSTGYVDQSKITVKGDVSRVDKGAIRESSNPDEEPFIAQRGTGGDRGHLGDFVEVTSDPNNPLRFARVKDAGPKTSALEGSVQTLKNLGISNPNPNSTGGGSYSYKTVAENPYRGSSADPDHITFDSRKTNAAQATPADLKGPGEKIYETDQKTYPADENLGNENTQYAGYLASKGVPYDNIKSRTALSQTMNSDKWKNDPAFQKYQKQVKDAIAKQTGKTPSQSGSDQVLTTPVPSVLGGPQALCLVAPGAQTIQGRVMQDGTMGFYLGNQLLPGCAIGNATTDRNAIVGGGLQNVIVFGPRTAAPAQPPPPPKPK